MWHLSIFCIFEWIHLRVCSALYVSNQYPVMVVVVVVVVGRVGCVR